MGKRLADETGASITLALLVFLVCAMASSVVIVSGTAAAGRLARMAERDRRYFKFISLGDTVKAHMAGAESVVVSEKDADGNETVTVDGEPFAPSTIAEELLSRLLFEDDALHAEAAKLTVSVEKDGGEVPFLGAELMLSVEDGKGVVRIQDGDYEIVQYYSPEISEVKDLRKLYGEEGTVETLTMTVTWEYDGGSRYVGDTDP